LMTDSKTTLGVIAVVVGLIGYAPYFRDILNGRTKPHFFSWFVWALLGGLAFFAQVVGHAGPGAWVTGCTAVICLVIAILALKKGEKEITKFDWLCLAGALLGIILWIKTKNPFSAVIFITLIDSMAFIPTFRKSYNKPGEETAVEYALAALKWTIGLFAIESFSLVTWLYPAVLIITNSLFVMMVLIRRRVLASSPISNNSNIGNES
ncbi:MAG: hypothetical protein Q7S32_01245, partial [bacterium]|nr:hypothetical protein [bacterium]